VCVCVCVCVCYSVQVCGRDFFRPLSISDQGAYMIYLCRGGAFAPSFYRASILLHSILTLLKRRCLLVVLYIDLQVLNYLI